MLPQTTVFCRRNLHITDGTRDWNLACTHPQSDVAFAAQEALAYSCNRYFADLADRIPPAQAAAILAHYGLAHDVHPADPGAERAPGIGRGRNRRLPSANGGRLSQAGAGTRRDPGPSWTVREGLKDSVSYGMAHNAAVPGMEIAGKTGTASDGPKAGAMDGLPAPLTWASEEVVIVIYLPHGNGADAARLAQRLLSRREQRRPPESARSLTVELWATRSVKTLTATPLSGSRCPTADRMGAGWPPASPGKTVKQLSLSGSFRMQARAMRRKMLAAGSWTITWQRDGLRVLLTLPSENYVIAALNGEAAPDEPMASLKAMAISIRTFALANASRHNAEGFGLCDSTHCQALRLGKARPEVERAVRETAGETLWFGGQRAHVYYTQHCGGMSEAAAAVWPAEHASYLAGNHADPYCLRRSPAEWHARIDLAQLSADFSCPGLADTLADQRHPRDQAERERPRRVARSNRPGRAG